MSDSLLPWNASAQERALEAATARVSDVPVPVRDMWDPDTCPAELLPWLAWAMSVDQWDTSWTDEQKREAVKSSFYVHRQKGTVSAVRAALTALGLDVRIVEWFDDVPAGEPYTFRVEIIVTDAALTQHHLGKALEVIDGAKNLRSHLTNVAPRLHAKGAGYFAGASLIGNEITIEPWRPSDAGVLTEDGRGLLYESGALQITE